MKSSVIHWLTAAFVLTTLVAIGNSAAAGPCRPDQVAGFYRGYTCDLTEAGVRSIPTNSTALRMLSTGDGRHMRGNLTLPRLSVLKVLEYDVTRGLDASSEIRPFGQLPDLEILQLFHATRADDFRFVLSAGIFSGLNGLKRLILSDLGLDDLPMRVFDGLDNLRILELNKNRLSQIPDGTFTACCQTLSVLTLSRNQISDLGLVSRQGLSRLRTLDLSGNKLTVLHELDFAGLENIVNIDLANNGLERISERSLRGLSRLESLHLSKNRLSFSNEDDDDDDSAPNTISSNQSEAVCRGPFCGLISLQTLDISHSNVSCLPAVHELVSLTKLDISWNNIDGLSYEQFACLQRLVELDLSRNHITTLSRAFRRAFNRLTFIDVSSNPWHCECDVYWMAEWLASTTYISPADEAYIEVNNLRGTRCAMPVPDQFLTEAYVNRSIECDDSGFDDEDTAETENIQHISTNADDEGHWANDKTTFHHETTDDVTGRSLSDPENIRLPSKADDTTDDNDHISKELTHFTDSSEDIVSSMTTTSPSSDQTTPQTMTLSSVTEEIRTLDEQFVTEMTKLEQMKTCDLLVSSVMDNMKTLDSLLQKTTENIDTLNRLLMTTIDTVAESAERTRERTSTGSLVADEQQRNSLSVRNRPNVVFQMSVILTVSVFVVSV